MTNKELAEKVNSSSWTEYRALVMEQIKTHKEELSDVKKLMSDLRTDLAVLQTKVQLAAILISLSVSLAVKVLPAIFFK